MEFGVAYTRVLESAFRRNTYANFPTSRILMEDGAYNSFIEVGINGKSFDLPVIAKQEFTISTERERVVSDKIQQELGYSSEDSKSGADAIVKRIFSCAPYEVVKVTTKKDEIYYGGRGLIMDSNLEPLVMLVVHCNLGDDVRDLDGITYGKKKVLINTKVFLNKDVVSKHIISKLIPFYMTHSIPSYDDNFNDIEDTKPPEIVFTNSIKYVHKVALPTMDLADNSHINDFVENNKEEVLKNLTW